MRRDALSGQAPCGNRPSVVAIGGGTGLSTLLRGLKSVLAEGEIRALTGIVTVSDDGGSSGRLRRDFGMLAPGDVRNCLVALADDEDMLGRLFQYRFPGGDGLTGHSFGNLFMAAVTGITGDFYQAILMAERVLSIAGRVLPATLTDVRLVADGVSGERYLGESAVGLANEDLTHIALDPPDPPAFAPAVEAIRAADLVVLGPGSLFTSVLPNLLIPEIAEALARRSCPSVLVLNLMTQPGETSGMDGLAHLAALESHAFVGVVDYVLANDAVPSRDSIAIYEETGSVPVSLSRLAGSAGDRLMTADLLAEGGLIRHDPGKVTRAILDCLYRQGRWPIGGWPTLPVSSDAREPESTVGAH